MGNDWMCPGCGGRVFGSKSSCRCGVKKGDWNCPNCRTLVFASKSQCRCGARKSGDNTSTSSSSNDGCGGNCSSGSGSTITTTTTSTSQMKKGDWMCPGCNYLVFASKPQCRCGVKRPDVIEPTSTDANKKECKVCFGTFDTLLALTPCNHYGFCKDCIPNFSRVCPICRSPIQSSTIIYI